MSEATWTSTARALAALRRLASRPPEPERCALCANTLADEHPHLVDPQNRRLLCACQACSILFDDAGVTRYMRVPRDVHALPGMHVDDGFWNSLGIPIGLVFFFRSSASGGVMAVYPSPGGPAETSVDEENWSELAGAHALLGRIRPDVEALLANRIGDRREYLLVPIDECYKLTGLIRRHWQGFSGGEDAWHQIGDFFDRLQERAVGKEAPAHA